jgi:hypothetical protein
MVNSTLANPQIRRPPATAGSLYDVLDLILDKGIVVDAFVRVSVVGIELITVDARVVIASVDTYLRYAEAVERLSLQGRSASSGRRSDEGGDGTLKQALSGAADNAKKAIGGAGQSQHNGGGVMDRLKEAGSALADKITGHDGGGLADRIADAGGALVDKVTGAVTGHNGARRPARKGKKKPARGRAAASR